MSREFIIKEHPLLPYDEEDKPQELIRCRECKKRKKNKFCLEHKRYEKNDEGFCSYGEREGE